MLCSFRCDGKLLAAGGESQMVQVFDVEHKTVLRQLKGHTGAVRAVPLPRPALHDFQTLLGFRARRRARSL